MCDGTTFLVTFNSELGNLPMITQTASLTGGSLAIAESQAGTKTLTECASHGYVYFFIGLNYHADIYSF